MNRYEEQVKAFLSGDEKAFETIYRGTYQTVYFTCLSFLKNEKDAEDITQDVYEAVYKNLTMLEEPAKLQAWISKIAVNKCKNYLKREKALLVEEESLGNVAVENDELLLPEEYVTNQAKRKVVMDIMKKTLSDVLYQTVVLFYFNELTVPEIAELMECPTGTVTYRLSVARARIKEGVEAYEKKNGEKLYSVAVVPLLALLLATEAEAAEIPNGTPAFLSKSKASIMPETVATAGGTLKAAGTGGIMSSIKIKTLIAVLCVVLVGGGLTAVIVTLVKKATDERQRRETIALIEEIKSEEQESLEAEQEARESVSEEEADPISEIQDSYENADIELLEEKYYNDEDIDLCNEFQGKVSDIFFDFEGGLMVMSDGKIYLADTYVEKILEPDKKYTSLYAFSNAFDNDSIVVYNEDGTITRYHNEGSVFSIELEKKFEGIPVQEGKEYYVYKENDIIILGVEENHAYLNVYAYEGGMPKGEKLPITEYRIPSLEGEDVDITSSVKEVLVLYDSLASESYASHTAYCLTDSNELYEIIDYELDDRDLPTTASCKVRYIASGVDEIYCDSAALGTAFTTPLYSKPGDSSKLYSLVYGEGSIEASDDLEVAFVLPDGHTTDELVQVFGASQRSIIFEFSNGDVYYTSEIDPKVAAEYTMMKLETISELNSQGHILAIAGASRTDENLYILMDDHKIYYMEMD